MGPVLFYDGACGLCHRAVRVLLLMDKGARLRFAPLGGETFRALVPAAERDHLPDSLLLVVPGRPPAVRSAAVLGAMRVVGGPWPAIALLGALVPRPLADRLYDAVARSRRRLFAVPRDACPVAPGPARARFLP